MSRFDRRSLDAQQLNLGLSLGLGAAIACLLFVWLITLLLHWLLLLAGIGVGGYGWRRQRQFQQRLYTCFYDCLQRHQGQISVLDFAIAAQITGPQAREFLDARAKDFFADFEPMTSGDILYSFRPPAPAPVDFPPRLSG